MSCRGIGLWLAIMLSAAAHADDLMVFGDDAYAPVIFQRQGGQPDGVLVRLLKRAEAFSGDRYHLQLLPWKRAYEMARRGEGGLIGVSYTQERAALFDFSKPVYDDDIRVVTLKGHEFPFNDLADLKGRLLGGVIGASYGERVDQAIAAGTLQIDRDIGQVGRLRKLLIGRLDAALIGNGQAGFEAVLASSPELLAKREQFVLLSRPLTRDVLHLAFPRQMDKSAALARFDAAMDKIRKEGGATVSNPVSK
jgi:ABC-type amino acid transport substrate-binding protein